MLQSPLHDCWCLDIFQSFGIRLLHFSHTGHDDSATFGPWTSLTCLVYLASFEKCSGQKSHGTVLNCCFVLTHIFMCRTKNCWSSGTSRWHSGQGCHSDSTWSGCSVRQCWSRESRFVNRFLQNWHSNCLASLFFSFFASGSHCLWWSRKATQFGNRKSHLRHASHVFATISGWSLFTCL